MTSGISAAMVTIIGCTVQHTERFASQFNSNLTLNGVDNDLTSLYTFCMGPYEGFALAPCGLI